MTRIKAGSTPHKRGPQQFAAHTLEVNNKEDQMVDKRQPIQNIATYRVPMTAVLNSRPVRIIATGDQPGHSPVCQYVSDNGRIDWDAPCPSRKTDL